MGKIIHLENERIHDATNLVKEVFFSSGNLGLDRNAAKSFLEFLSMHAKDLTWIGYMDPDVKGVLAYTEGHLSLLFVRTEDTHAGIATKLVQYFLQEEKEAGIQRITLNALGSSVGFYKSLGFEKAGEPSKAGGMEYQLMEYLMGRENLGKVVSVRVDQRYGSLHSIIPDLCLPCNIGYVEDYTQEDFQDAYIYGVYEPVEQFKGVVIGIIYHRDESETRWIVASGNQYDRQDVLQVIAPLETDYDVRIEWL